ncbi:hypothetical protein BDR07DRAFT_1292544 [Suillus spraguei]|nr:hypothetical protein BDR07DRAFT_1292544 [Suillus spraguei]
MPLITQSDLGTENYGIANAQTLLCQCYDPTLQGTLQHRWMHTKKNMMLEITWSQLQRRFTPGFETLLDEGVIEGWYDTGNTLHMMVFHWVFIPWLQQELNAYRDRVNNTAKRRDRNKVLPHGVPNLIYETPEDFGALDFKVTVDHEGIDYIRNFYINTAHPVFDLVPPMLCDFIEHCYDAMGCPAVTLSSVWTVYRHVLSAVQLAENPHPDLLPVGDEHDIMGELPLIGGHADLPFNEEQDGMYYMGGVHAGLGLGMTWIPFNQLYADEATDESHICDIDTLLTELGEPDVPLDDGPIENQVGINHMALVVWEFSSDESENGGITDKW